MAGTNSDTEKSNTFLKYAKFYDLLYSDKDYKAESQYIDSLINKFIKKPKNEIKILDLACGTGKHAMEFCDLGYIVEGSDISKDMIDVATITAKEQNKKIKFYNESFQTCNAIEKKYDVIVAMFGAIDYLVNVDELNMTFNNIHDLLASGGIFIFDFWNGNAVIKDYSKERKKEVELEENKVVRTSSTTLDLVTQRALVKFKFDLSSRDQKIETFTEEHLIRYFFIQEMHDLLRINGYTVLHKCPFLEIDNELIGTEWNVTFVVQTSSRTSVFL
jgi:2-polyprenyl-3-methyl-5-hydroxy-6-metoxy-1,4-benzoquinol methylase